MKRLLISLCFIGLISLNIMGQSSAKYRIWLSDKAGSEYSIEHPEAFLSQKSIERRAKCRIDSTERDLHISTTYRQSIESLGTKIIVSSRWMNTAVIATDNKEILTKIEALPFVTKIECVQPSLKNIKTDIPHHKTRLLQDESYLSRPTNRAKKNPLYGMAWDQLHMINLDSLHQAGYYGKDITIAVLDAGFPDVDTHPYMKNIQIIGTHDFTQKAFSYSGVSHGTTVLICMAAYAPGRYIGAAPEANYVLIVTEDNRGENSVEEDYWAAGVEMADSIGADIINSSLGYNTFDDPSQDYTTADLDGQTAFSTRIANIAAQKGLLVVSAAGNEYNNSWEKINVPSDAFGILTVGSVDVDGQHSFFSSIGNTTDGRIKPDVAAIGEGTYIINKDGSVSQTTGTSFSTPIISGALACLWQALPDLSAEELIDAVRKSSSQYHSPDSLIGYGIPNIYSIFCDISGVNDVYAQQEGIYATNGTLHIPHMEQQCSLSIYSTTGQVVHQQELATGQNTINIPHITKGIYIVTLTTKQQQIVRKIAIG